jgi:hypothetical protein
VFDPDLCKQGKTKKYSDYTNNNAHD